jgi:protein-S-isoprenylcysteine O-methyltransferase Ste14
MVKRTLALAYGIVCYVLFLGTFLYAVGFLANRLVPKSIDSGVPGAVLASVVVDLVLLGAFALQHSVMARPAFKRAWTRVVPRAVERSTYVLAASLVLILLFWQWRPLPEAVWTVRAPAGRGVLWALFAVGWLMVLFGTFMISHAHLFGVSQVWAAMRGRPLPEPHFQTRGFYGYIRHPLMLGFLIAFCATPEMTAGHLLFAGASTGYILLATLAFEERDLERFIGEPYRRYRREVPAFIPRIGPPARAEDFLRPGGEPESR